MGVRIKLYGLHRTGTNAVGYLLDTGIPGSTVYHHRPGCGSDYRGHGFKHGAPVELPLIDLYALCVKSLWAWFPSVRRYRANSRGKREPTPEAAVREWEANLRSMWRFKRRPDAMIVRHETMLVRPASVVRHAGRLLGMGDAELVVTGTPDTAMGRGGPPGRVYHTRKPFDRAYYTEHGYMAEWRDGEVGRALAVADVDLWRACGYSAAPP